MRLSQVGKNLLKVTEECRDDMHEPDEQGLSARVVGYELDNAMGSSVTADAIIGGYQELVVVLNIRDEEHLFNLADIIALARIGASSKVKL